MQSAKACDRRCGCRVVGALLSLHGLCHQRGPAQQQVMQDDGVLDSKRHQHHVRAVQPLRGGREEHSLVLHGSPAVDASKESRLEHHVRGRPCNWLSLLGVAVGLEQRAVVPAAASRGDSAANSTRRITRANSVSGNES
eukprot:scaffold4036_cov236-Pinguiococcus_pyrenoidosus.AAC.7